MGDEKTAVLKYADQNCPLSLLVIILVKVTITLTNKKISIFFQFVQFIYR